MTVLKCPNCGGSNILVEKRINGNTLCNDCRFTVPSSQASVFLFKDDNISESKDINKLLVEG